MLLVRTYSGGGRLPGRTRFTADSERYVARADS